MKRLNEIVFETEEKFKDVLGAIESLADSLSEDSASWVGEDAEGLFELITREIKNSF